MEEQGSAVGMNSGDKGGRPPLRPKPSMSDILSGEKKEFKADLKPHLPQDLIGGSLPHIAGAEDNAVWNAASQACGTEKVHYAYTVDEGRIWYLACPSASMASNPDSWCPMVAALPGNSEYWDKETVYLFEQEGQASALRWDPETGRMQVFLGASRTILPRVQSMDANFVTINPNVSDVYQWKNKTLKTEQLSRAVVRTLVYSGLIVNAVIAMILILNLVSISFVDRNLEQLKEKTDSAALELVQTASNVMQSDAINHMVRVQKLLDKLALSNGYLIKYEVEKNKTTWQAIVPQALANKAIEDATYRSIVNKRIVVKAPQVKGRLDGDKVLIEGRK